MIVVKPKLSIETTHTMRNKTRRMNKCYYIAWFHIRAPMLSGKIVMKAIGERTSNEAVTWIGLPLSTPSSMITVCMAAVKSIPQKSEQPQRNLDLSVDEGLLFLTQ